MRVLIVGGSGMLGHKLWQVFASRFDTYVTLRRGFDSYNRYGLFNSAHTVDCVSAEDFDSVVRAIDAVRPAVVINCIGIVKQAEAANDPLASIDINALFPHRLAKWCQGRGMRLIHISTDCVFSGRKGNYREGDVPDAEDLYGRTKLLGEVSDEGCLTIRTSMIGRELETSNGLIEWFLNQEDKTISGYKKSVFSGFTTNALAEIIAGIITKNPELHGVWHVASEPISKFELLSLVKQVYGLNIRIEPDETVVCDRSLNSERFRKVTGFVPPTWHDMIEQMYRDSTPYSELRRHHANQ
jgi:dTDP-4-dehydrorhamnose reductase